jgi:TonB family protein
MMASSDALLNLAAYMLQIACIAALAEVTLRLIPVASAGFRYAYWRLVLAGALVMPWVLRAAPPAVEPGAAEPVIALSPGIRLLEFSEAAMGWTASAASWPAVVPWILAAGIAARMLWVAAGVARLRALRRRGDPVADATYQEIQQLLGTNAELRSVPGIAQPVTFGVRRPIVLLPEHLAGSTEAIRRAALTHELVHVHRRDWLWVMAEEALRAVFWFHPAIWWLTARIQLTREEFTDHLAVLATGSRRSYMEALLAFAEGASFKPAPAFARRAHLFHRLVLLSKESAMSSRRIVTSGAALTALLVTGGWYASEAFPVGPAASRSIVPAAAARPAQQPGGAAEQVNPITPDNPIPRRVFATPIQYPLALAGTGLESAVEVNVVLNAAGGVSTARMGAASVGSARPASNVNEREAMETFVAAAIEAIKQWQYEPPFKAPIAFYVAVTFKPGAEAIVSQSERSRGVSAGPTGAAIGRAAVSLGARSAGAGPAGPAAVAAPPSVRTLNGVEAVRVGGAIRAPTQIRKVNPEYPAIAQSARVQGVVILEVLIDQQGRVSDIRVLRSIPLLDQAAIDAVRQWEYMPTLLNGVPVPVVMTTTVQFTPEP